MKAGHAWQLPTHPIPCPPTHPPTSAELPLACVRRTSGDPLLPSSMVTEPALPAQWRHRRGRGGASNEVAWHSTGEASSQRRVPSGSRGRRPATCYAIKHASCPVGVGMVPPLRLLLLPAPSTLRLPIARHPSRSCPAPPRHATPAPIPHRHPSSNTQPPALHSAAPDARCVEAA